METSPPKPQTRIEAGTELSGVLKSSAGVIVQGTLEGEVHTPELRVTAVGAVQGHVHAQRFRSEGIVAGVIDADEVYISGVVCGHTRIRAHQLELKLSRSAGKFELNFGDSTEPTDATPREPTGGTGTQAAAPSTSED